LIKETRVFRTD
jgi:hypothetical protein